ncbi:MAG: hypothetical protein Q8S12_00305 [Hydrogenophaga sp.]|uniref:hypothetical protein n=1 Tax=Hydrogenophaga sp. TaxID=1904254 RepID=UPI00273750EE|nr:hypothetical protein [Hydrogenophaga sp.]MDP3625007.1 hypothetical protein [Hydrogenophaga sp.]
MSTWHFASGIVSLFAALALCLIVLNQRINEGVIIKVGLIGMIISLLVTFALTVAESRDWEAYWRASFVTRCSVLVVCIGLIVRARSYVNRLREAIDIPCDFHEGMTRSILRRITEPAHDLAMLFNADSAPAPLEPDRKKARQ